MGTSEISTTLLCLPPRTLSSFILAVRYSGNPGSRAGTRRVGGIWRRGSRQVGWRWKGPQVENER